MYVYNHKVVLSEDKKMERKVSDDEGKKWILLYN